MTAFNLYSQLMFDVHRLDMRATLGHCVLINKYSIYYSNNIVGKMGNRVLFDTVVMSAGPLLYLGVNPIWITQQRLNKSSQNVC